MLQEHEYINIKDNKTKITIERTPLSLFFFLELIVHWLIEYVNGLYSLHQILHNFQQLQAVTVVFLISRKSFPSCIRE